MPGCEPSQDVADTCHPVLHQDITALVQHFAILGAAVHALGVQCISINRSSDEQDLSTSLWFMAEPGRK